MERGSHQTVRLEKGQHTSPQRGVCVMELASMLAGERFTDRPRSVSPCIAAVLRGYNDGLDDERRQTLKRFAAATVGTAAGKDVERQRRRCVRAELVDPDRRWGAFVALSLRLHAVTPTALGRLVGDRVASSDDDALHARTLALVDKLIAMGGDGRAAEDWMPRRLSEGQAHRWGRESEPPVRDR
jgi:hypothetical protein